jgi:hypothetical protein
MREVHLVNYSESIDSAEYRVTSTPGADGLHLTIVQVPALPGRGAPAERPRTDADLRARPTGRASRSRSA